MESVFHILVVDDEPPIVDSVVRMLQSKLTMRTEIFQAYRSRTALNILNENRIDLLIADIHIPDMNGLQLLEEVNRRWPNCKTILLTGYARFEYAYEAMSHHAAAYVLKADDGKALLDTVNDTLTKIQQQWAQASYPAPNRPSDLQQAQMQQLFSAALQNQQPLILRHALPLMGFSEPYNHLIFLMSMVHDARDTEADALLERILTHYFDPKTRFSMLHHPVERSSLWLCQFEEMPSQVCFSGVLEQIQSAYSAVTGRNISFVVSRIVGGESEIPKFYEQLCRQGQLLCPQLDTAPFIYTTAGNTISPNDSTLMSFIDSYVSAHIREDISIAQLSLVTGYNVDYLSRMYRQSSGCTLGRYLVNRRLAYIRSLLSDPALPLDTVSQMSGFSSRSYFNRFIKRETALTPTQYQTMIQNGVTFDDSCLQLYDETEL